MKGECERCNPHPHDPVDYHRRGVGLPQFLRGPAGETVATAVKTTMATSCRGQSSPSHDRQSPAPTTLPTAPGANGTWPRSNTLFFFFLVG